MIFDTIVGELFSDDCILSHEIITKNGKTETVIKLSSGKQFMIGQDSSIKVKESCGQWSVCVPRDGYNSLIKNLTVITEEHTKVVALFDSLKTPEKGIKEACGPNLEACGPNLEACGPHLSILAPANMPRGTPEAAGFDIMCNQDVSLPPGVVIKVPTGLHVAVPKGHVGLICDRSSMGSKGITVLGGVIDSDYRGELKVMLLNTTNVIHQFHQGDRVAQMIVVPVVTSAVYVPTLDTTERGSNGFGSTGV